MATQEQDRMMTWLGIFFQKGEAIAVLPTSPISRGAFAVPAIVQEH